MKKINTQRLVLLAMMIALTTVCTWLIRIPGIVPNGYVNAGDTLLMFTGLLLGPAAGFTAGAFGSSLADLLAGFPIYAPITFVVKGFEGFVCGWIYKKLNHKYATAATLAGGVLMALGYFIGESIFLYGMKGAAVDLPGNMIQGVTNAFLAVLLNRSLSFTTKNFISR